MTAPDFFIIGAPKCGTTALSEYLRSHPSVFMCEPKEPHYFATDFPVYRHVTDWDAYLQLFATAAEQHSAIGEASVFYLYSDSAVRNILSAIPSARFIVMLRNPVDIAISMHAQALYSTDEDVRDFQSAWRLCEARRGGCEIPQRARDLKPLLYDQVAQVGAQMKRLLDTVPPDRVRWFFFEDLEADPRALYREVLEFLDVEDDGRENFDRINRRKRHKVASLARLTQATPPKIVWMASAIKELTGIRRIGLLDRLRRLNEQSITEAGVPQGFRCAMASFFEPDIRLLASITGRSLDHWREPPDTTEYEPVKNVAG